MTLPDLGGNLTAQLDGLGDEQRQAVLAMLLIRNQVIGIQGRAGVGKTTLLAAARTLAKRQGYTVQGLAPSASAARELASTGMPAETIATFMRREYKGLDAKTILVVDEAGMTSTTQMLSILKAAQEVRCRVVLVGDTAQLAAVEAGKPFAQLQANGMATALVGQIRRQRNAVLKKAVEHAVEGQVTLAVDLLDKDITQIVSADERYDRIAADYVALVPQEREQTRVIAGTRHARSAINCRIRERLGLTGSNDFTLLSRKDLTDAGRRSTLSYDTGDVVQSEVDYAALGLKRGELARVVARLDHRILLERSDGTRVAWQPATMPRMSSFVPEIRPLAQGDLVRVSLTASVDDPAPYLRGVTEMEAERSALLSELNRVKSSVAQTKSIRQFGIEDVRKLLDALWRDLEERQEVAETRAALQGMISKIELEPGATQVTIHYAVPVVSACSADTTGVTLASPRGFEPRFTP